MRVRTLARISAQRRIADWRWDLRQTAYLSLTLTLTFFILLYPAAIRASLVDGPKGGNYSVAVNGPIDPELVEEALDMPGVSLVTLAVNVIPKALRANEQSLTVSNGYFFISGDPSRAGPLAPSLRVDGGPLNSGVAIDWATARRLRVGVGDTISVDLPKPLDATVQLPVEAIYQPTGRFRSFIAAGAEESARLLRGYRSVIPREAYGREIIASDMFIQVADNAAEATSAIGIRSALEGQDHVVRTRLEEIAEAEEEYARVLPSMWRRVFLLVALGVVVALVRREQSARQERQLSDAVHLLVLGLTAHRTALANSLDFLASILSAAMVAVGVTIYLASARFVIFLPDQFKINLVAFVAALGTVGWILYYLGSLKRLNLPATFVERDA